MKRCSSGRTHFSGSFSPIISAAFSCSEWLSSKLPLIGYFAGTLIADFFSRFAPWIALALLAFIGGKMIWESLREEDTEAECKDLTLWHIIVLAIATSIDALVTGVIFIPCSEVLWLGIGVIALVSFLFSIVGTLVGIYAGEKLIFASIATEADAVCVGFIDGKSNRYVRCSTTTHTPRVSS